MRYLKTVDIWEWPEAERARLQPGQWVAAGEARGRYLGQKPGGSDVVAWQGRTRHRWKSYVRSLRDYATAT
ncbi:hypothetical protein ACVIRO_001238 [Rhizobium ruizarguesonis]